MKNVRSKGTDEKSGTPPSVEALGSNFHVRHYKRFVNSPHWYEPECVAARDWKSDSVASIVYMIKEGILISMQIRMISYR